MNSTQNSSFMFAELPLGVGTPFPSKSTYRKKPWQKALVAVAIVLVTEITYKGPVCLKVWLITPSLHHLNELWRLLEIVSKRYLLITVEYIFLVGLSPTWSTEIRKSSASAVLPFWQKAWMSMSEVLMLYLRFLHNISV